MHAQLARLWYAIRYSYWFVSALMALAAIALAGLTTAIDLALPGGWADRIPLLSLDTPDGARAVLSTIAASMITVAGVTFSITIAAVVFATGQLGPRLLANFMGDTSNQITLGAFIATFVYGLLILRTVQGSDAVIDAAPFVPRLGVLTALAFALASIAALIYFIHHVPQSISASQMVARLGDDLNAHMRRLFPERFGAGPSGEGDLAAAVAELPTDDGWPVLARENGYITYVDAPGLLRLASHRDCIVRLQFRTGDFVNAGDRLATVHGGPADDDFRDDVVDAVIQASERTHDQDVLFIVQQLVEIAIRALSPAVNDPFTANRCVDWLGSSLINLGQRVMPSRFYRDDGGRIRVVVPALSFDDVAAGVFDQLRPYAAGDRNVALHMMETLERLSTTIDYPPYQTALLDHAAALHDASKVLLVAERDRLAIEEVYVRLFERDSAEAT